MADNKVYVLDSGANQYEAMTKEQILTAITQAVNDGTISNIDAGFITKIQEMNKNGVLKWWVGSQAEFNALDTKDANTLYLFTDDPLYQDLLDAIDDVDTKIDNETESRENLGAEVNNIKNGTTEVKKANETKILNIVNTDSLSASTTWVTKNSGGSINYPNGKTITIPSSLIPNDGSYVYLNINYDVSMNDNSSIHLNLPIAVSKYNLSISVLFEKGGSSAKDKFAALIKVTSNIYAAAFELEITNATTSGDNITFVITPSNFTLTCITNPSTELMTISSSLATPRVTLLKQIEE